MIRYAKEALVLLSLSTANLAPAQYIHANGTTFQDGAGRQIQLKGPDLGCWLYFEPWMVNAGVFPNWLDAAGTTDTFQQEVTQLVGAANAQKFWTTFRRNMVTEPDIQKIADLGFNCVRVTMDYRLFYNDQSGEYLTTNYQYIDNLLTWCAKNKVYAILDMHTVPGGQDIYNTDSIYVSTGHQAVLRNVWKRVATRYANNPWVAGYDLMNEPVVNGDPSLKAEYQDLTNTIRTVDRHHTIFVEGDWYASALWLLGGLWDSNMAYSDHNYASTLPNGLPSHEDQATLYNAPLWMGEYGFNSNTWNAQQESYLNAPSSQNGRSIQASWDFWAWKAIAIWSTLNIPTPPAYQLLLNYWNGDAPKPNPTTAMNGLMAFANAVKYENCVPNRDTIDAYTRADFLTAGKPFTGNAIPGRVECVSYDMGPEGIAYHNNLSSNTGGMGSGFESWNNGWIYRNDGVDITTAPGDNATGYCVGWTASGQWMNYTLQCKPGTYALTIRYSGPGGNLHFNINGVNVTGTISLPQGPNGGDWGTFGTITIPSVAITASGRVTVQIYQDTGGFNLDWFQFE